MPTANSFGSSICTSELTFGGWLCYWNRKKEQLKEKPKDIEAVLKRSKGQEFNDQAFDINFSTAMMCLPIIRYLTDYSKYIPVSVLHHLLVETDILCILVPLIEQRPWIRTNSKGEREKFENYKWVVVPKSDYSVLSKMEAQVKKLADWTLLSLFTS